MANNWTVVFYEDEAGRLPAEEWIEELNDAKYAALRAAIKHVLQDQGLALSGTLWMTPLGDSLYEFRVKHSARQILSMFAEVGQEDLPANPPGKILLRLFVHFHGDRAVMLLGGYDKGRDDSPRRQQAEIKKARKMLTDWKLRERRKGKK